MKAVAFDLDDTLLHDDLTISDYTVSVFHRLSESGIRLVAASGRAQQSMQPHVDRLGCVSLCIACNGAEIWDTVTGRLLCQELLPADLSREIAAFAEERGIYAQVYRENCFFFNRYGTYADRYAVSASLTGVYAGDLRAFIHEPQTKILMMADETEIASLLPEARQIFRGRASVTCSKPWYLEFNPLKATKGNALKTAAGILGMLPGDFIAFGDSLNDLSMLQAAGISVSVANGWKEILPCCNAVCESNNQDGPARYLETHYLTGRDLI